MAEEGLARDTEQDGARKGRERGQLIEEGAIVVERFAEADAWVEHEVFWMDSGIRE